MDSPIGQIYSMEQAAAALRISRRKLQTLVKAHPFYADNGGRKLFSEADIKHLWEAMRCHLANSNDPTGTGISGAPLGGNPYMSLLGRAMKRTQNSRAKTARTNSSNRRATV